MKSWEARALALSTGLVARIQLSLLQLSFTLARNWGPVSRNHRPRPPEIRTTGQNATHSVRTFSQVKRGTSEQALKIAFSREYLINPFLYNRNIGFHRFPEYFRKYIYWQVNLRSREELNKEKVLIFLLSFHLLYFIHFWNEIFDF